MNAITETKAARPSLIASMANKHNMDPDQFAKTVRTTVMPAKHTNEQFAALMLVANEYNLNPVVKEIYAFPAKGGGIVPVVSVDGWLNLVNSHPQCDGFEIEFNDDEKGDPISCTCKMYRKDRKHPVEVTEYLSECIRNTEPWKMKHRMLRHKAVIQAARYAFGFSGIYDEDEGAKIAEMRDITPPAPPPEPADAEETAVIEAEPDEEIHAEADLDAGVIEGEIVDDGEYLNKLDETLAVAMDEESITEVWDDFNPDWRFGSNEVNLTICTKMKERHLERVNG